MATYSQLLQQPEWYSKCDEILLRDKCKCQRCGCMGYHANSAITLDKIEDLDRVFTDTSFNGMTMCSFFKSLMEDKEYMQKVTVDREYINNDEQGAIDIVLKTYFYKRIYIEDRSLPAVMKISDSTHLDTLTSDERWSNLEVIPIYRKTVHQLYGKNLYVTCEFEKGINTYFTGAAFYKSNFELSSTPIISFNSLRVNRHSFEDVVISITYKNFNLSMYFFPGGWKYVNGHSESVSIRGLNVHHKYYTINRSPWDYPNEALITLCQDCHKKLHEKTSVPIYRSLNNIIGYTSTCPRCGGSGYLPQYKHYMDGICFECWGEGIDLSGLE